MKPYVVCQGEHLQQIAHRLGFDAASVWAAKENDKLRAERADPNILAACDVLYVPDEPLSQFKLKIGSVNTFVASVPSVTVSVKVAIDGKACANESYLVTGGGSPSSGTTGPDGAVTFSVPLTTTQVSIALVSKSIHFPVLIGHLDPATTESGVRQRLSHLGLLRNIEDPAAISLAIEHFQSAQRLPVTGAVDDTTRKALVAAHGS